MSEQLTFFKDAASDKNVVNVSSVPQRSPFRYPGGKTWLIPVVRKWLKQLDKPVDLLLEPFAGGGIVGLTAAMESLAQNVLLVEKDEEIAAVWRTMLNGDAKWLAERIMSFDLTHENAKTILSQEVKSTKELAFATILKNRIFHGGILANGSGMIKRGENGKGLSSRWYPKTLKNRILAIEFFKEKIQFIHGDAFLTLDKFSQSIDTFHFIDPPYTKAGKRLYKHSDIDHELLFKKVSELKGHYMLTYDESDEILGYAEKYNLQYKRILMRTTHHLKKYELLICDNFDWY